MGRMAGTASIGGSSLKRRIQDILSVEPPRKLGLRGCALTAAFGLVLAAFSTGFGLAILDAYAIKRIQHSSEMVSIENPSTSGFKTRECSGSHAW